MHGKELKKYMGSEEREHDKTEWEKMVNKYGKLIADYLEWEKENPKEAKKQFLLNLEKLNKIEKMNPCKSVVFSEPKNIITSEQRRRAYADGWTDVYKEK